MPKGSITFHVARPPADVFAVVGNLERAPEWVRDLVSVEKVTEGPIAVGTKYKEIVQIGKSQSPAELEITEYDPPRVMANRGKGGPTYFSARFKVEADGAGSRVTHDYSMKMTGLFWLFTPLVGGWMKKNVKLGVADLCKLLEGETS